MTVLCLSGELVVELFLLEFRTLLCQISEGSGPVVYWKFSGGERPLYPSERRARVSGGQEGSSGVFTNRFVSESP